MLPTDRKMTRLERVLGASIGTWHLLSRLFEVAFLKQLIAVLELQSSELGSVVRVENFGVGNRE